MSVRFGVAVAVFMATTNAAFGQSPIRLREPFAIDYQYHVSTRVELTGQLSVPAESGQAASTIEMRGGSAIEYDERILEAGASDKPVTKSLRIYRRVDLQRTVGGKPQEASLRPSVRRLVILRTGHREVPFSPDGPLTMAEIDLIRTDVFTPALAALLPDRPVSPGDRWQAGVTAIEELTDIEKIDEGGIECRFDEITTLAGRRLARIRIAGTVKGVNDDGPNRQTLDGYFYFDLGSHHLSYLSLSGTSLLLDKDGKTTGTVKGQFVLTRQANAHSRDLSDDVVRKLTLTPNADNSLLLYDNADLGLRFEHSRRWRVSSVRGRQVTLDEPAGNGLLISVETLKDTPATDAYLAQAKAYLAKERATVLGHDSPRRISGSPNEIEQFGVDLDFSGQKARMEYFLCRQTAGGAVIAARLTPRDLAIMRPEVERIVRSVRIDPKRAQ